MRWWGRLRPGLRRLNVQVGFRGVILLFLAMLDIVSAYRLVRPDPEVLRTPTNIYLASILPLWVWAIPWAVTGVICLAQAFADHDRLAFGAAAGLKIMWAVVTACGGLAGIIPQAYWGTVIWAALAGVVMRISGWPEPGQGR